MIKSKNGSAFPSNGQFSLIDKILNPSPFCKNDLDSVLLPINPIYNSNYLLLNPHFILHSCPWFLTLPFLSQQLQNPLKFTNLLSFRPNSSAFFLLTSPSYLYIKTLRIYLKCYFNPIEPAIVVQYLKSFISRHPPIKIWFFWVLFVSFKSIINLDKWACWNLVRQFPIKIPKNHPNVHVLQKSSTLFSLIQTIFFNFNFWRRRWDFEMSWIGRNPNKAQKISNGETEKGEKSKEINVVLSEGKDPDEKWRDGKMIFIIYAFL